MSGRQRTEGLIILEVVVYTLFMICNSQYRLALLKPLTVIMKFHELLTNNVVQQNLFRK